MKSSEFPTFVRSLPEADLSFDGLRGWLLQNEADIELTVPQHSHGNQWGVVIDGRIDLKIGELTKTYMSGETYFIPEGTPHQARIYPGFRAIDYFADRDRYRVRSHNR